MSTLMNRSPLKTEATNSRPSPHLLTSLRTSPHASPHSLSLRTHTSPECSPLGPLLASRASPHQQEASVVSLSPSSCEDSEPKPRYHGPAGAPSATSVGSDGGYSNAGLASSELRHCSGIASFREGEEDKMIGKITPGEEFLSSERSAPSECVRGTGCPSEKPGQARLTDSGSTLSVAGPHLIDDDSDEDDFNDESMRHVKDEEHDMECGSDKLLSSNDDLSNKFSESIELDESKVDEIRSKEIHKSATTKADNNELSGDVVFSHIETEGCTLPTRQDGIASRSESTSYCSENDARYVREDKDIEDEKEIELMDVSNNDDVRKSNGMNDTEPREENAEDDDDDDQIECADCNKIFVNLQAYMDHTCCRSKQNSEGDMSPQETLGDSKDAESFRGDIVYTPSGSAYILEAGSVDMERDLSLTPEAIVVRDGQTELSMPHALPRIDSAVFVPRRQSPPPYRSDLQQHAQFRDSHGMTSFNVFDLKSTPADALLPYFPSCASLKDLLPKPVLMCFICKFSFGFHKSFLRHALNDHAIHMSSTEELLVCRPSVSAIIHTRGKEKLPNVSVLKAVTDAKLRLFGKPQTPSRSGHVSHSLSQGDEYTSSSSTPTIENPFSASHVNNEMMRWPTEAMRSHTSKGQRPSVILEAGRMSIAHSPTPQSMNGMRIDLDSCGRRWTPPGRSPHDPKYSGPSPPSPIQPSNPNSKSSINHSRPRSPPQARRGSPSPSLPDTDSSSTGQLVPAASSSGACLPGTPSLMMMSSAPGPVLSSRPTSHSLPSHVGMAQHPPPGSPVSTISFSMHPFFSSGGCEEHGPGGTRSGECAKCDVAHAVSSNVLAQASMNASNGNGGAPSHMTLSHSRNSCKTLKCPKCNWHYKYQETLEIHMKEKHPDSDAQCVYCLTNQAHPRLARGESYSCGYKPYRCEVCNYSTTTKGNLSIHMQSDKHINNMQDLASGGVDIKMTQHHHHQHQHQHPQAPSTQSLPPSSVAHPVTTGSSVSFPMQQDESPHVKLSRPSSAGHPSGLYTPGIGSSGPSNSSGSKHKQSFRCDVCSYETSVARNLRIHMTSEKHTQNMLVMSQSMSQLQQDFTLHQMTQMNQFLAMTSHQEQQAAAAAAAAAARFAVLSNSRHPHPSHHLAAQMFPYDQATALQIMSVAAASSSSSSSSSSASSAAPSSSLSNAPLSLPHPPQLQHGSNNFDLTVNLTKEPLEFSGDPHHPMVSRVDAQKLFVCCVCNKFASDSLENIHNHIQFDRTKMGNSDTQVTFNNGTYHCNLCIYKTHLKANFQLHCKTDKHLQKLQLVNHIQEGGPENEWRMANFITSIPPTNSSSSSASSPMQICCNACGFYANSSHKMQLHVSTIQHESSAQLFKHLQLLDRATPPPVAGNLRLYQCTICPANFPTKQRLVLHARSPHHMRKEQALPLGQISILSVFLVKEMKESESTDHENRGE